MTIDITNYDRLTSDNQVRLLNILLDTNKKLERIAIAFEEKEKESKWLRYQMRPSVPSSHWNRHKVLTMF